MSVKPRIWIWKAKYHLQKSRKKGLWKGIKCPETGLNIVQMHKRQCVLAVDSPLSCSMKQTFPWALKAKVSGVIHRVWKRWEGLMLCSARTHSAHTAHTSSSDRQLSRRERMSARDTFSCGHKHTHTSMSRWAHICICCVETIIFQVKSGWSVWYNDSAT